MNRRPSIFLHSAVDTHHSYLAVLLDLLGDSADVVLAVSAGLRRNLEPRVRVHSGGIRVIELPSGIFLSPEAADALRAADGAVFDEPFSLREMAGMLRLVLGRRRPPFLLTIHNADSWFFPRPVPSPSGLAATVLRRSILGRTGHCIVVGRNIRDYLHNRDISPEILVVPFGFDRDIAAPPETVSDHPEPGRRTRFVIPGTVSERRDYDTALAAFGKDELRENATLVLLGKPAGAYGRGIMEAGRSIAARGFEIVGFDSFVPGERFAAEMRAADVILSPFTVRYVTIDGQVEYYGRTKETGVAPLALNTAKPLLVPADYAPPPEIATQVISYRSRDDLAALMIRIAREPGFLEPYALAARRNLGAFDLTGTRRHLLAALDIGEE